MTIVKENDVFIITVSREELCDIHKALLSMNVMITKAMLSVEQEAASLRGNPVLPEIKGALGQTQLRNEKLWWAISDILSYYPVKATVTFGA